MIQEQIPQSRVEHVLADDEQRCLQLARQLLESLHTQGRAADEKIRVLFGATALLVAALAFGSQATLTQLRAGGFGALEVAIIVGRALMLMAVGGAVSAGILALLPRIRPGRAERSLFFFGHITTVPHDQFIREFRQLPMRDALDQVLSQVYINAEIVQVKYAWTRRSALYFMASVVGLILVRVLEFFA